MDFKPNKEFMQRAIDLSERASIKEKSGGVFGSVVVLNDEIIGEGYNQVIRHNDPTWHAEMEAIRVACKKVGSPHLEGAVLYTSAESCPMCLSAAYWAHIDIIVYASTIEDSQKYGDFQDVNIYQELCLPSDERSIKSTQFMRPEAVEVWKKFHDMPDRAIY